MLLIVDYREQWFVNMIREIPACTESVIKYDNVEVTFRVDNVPVGDFIIQDTTGNVCCVIERKTISDLSASIVDGRFRQQKERLSQVENVVYLIEGSFATKQSLPVTTVYSAVQNLIFKHNIKVLQTGTPRETMSMIVLLYKKFVANEFDKQSLIVAPTMLVSKRQKVCENIFGLQLNVIPGVSYTMALAVCKVYSSMKQLLEAYLTAPEECRPVLLADIQYTSKRKIGKAVSTKIFKAVYE